VIPANDLEIIGLEPLPSTYERVMMFKLIYDGPLPADKDGTAAIKQAIRRQIRPQLRELWHTHPFLNGDDALIPALASEFERFGYRFVPLLRRNNHMVCRIDMLLLLRQTPYGPMLNGDLDNRVKTLLDGLRMPGQRSEMGPGDTGPTADETEFFVLLEDDASICEFQIRTDQLLAPKRPDQASRDVIALLEVQIMNANRTAIASATAGFDFIPSR
jgi:hypothetical protein